MSNLQSKYISPVTIQYAVKNYRNMGKLILEYTLGSSWGGQKIRSWLTGENSS